MAPENPVPREYAMQWQKVKGMVVVLELCPRGNNKDVIIIILVHDNVYIPC
jgi:hypothetical protein